MARHGARFFFSWRLLAFERRRILAAVAGIAFAVILMLVQLGFYNAMIASATKVDQAMNADLVMVPAAFEYFGSQHDFARVRLMQVAAMPGVASVAPMYVTLMNVKDVDSGYNRAIMVMGIEPGRRELTLPGLTDHEDALKIAGNVMFDRKSLQAYYGDVVSRFRRDGPFRTLIAGRPVKIAGLFELGTSFVAFGNIVMGSSTFFALNPQASPELPSFGLIRLKPGTDPQVARDRIARALDASDVRVETKAQFIRNEVNYWNTTAAIGFIFIVGAAMGVLVGAVVVYQILFTDVTEHLPEYATLKAMGYPGRFFAGVVLQQSVILSLLGFLPGALISWAVFLYSAQSTSYTMDLTPSLAGTALALTLAMCVAAGLLAMRKLNRADPAELFR